MDYSIKAFSHKEKKDYPTERYFGYAKKDAIMLYRDRHNLKYKRVEILIEKIQHIF